MYTLPGGLQYTVSPTTTAGTVGPMMSGGSNSYGVWVKFTAGEQRMIIGGGGAALATAICLIPGVGAGLCIVSAAIIAAAGIYITDHGVCSNRLLIYPFVPERNRCA